MSGTPRGADARYFAAQPDASGRLQYDRPVDERVRGQPRKSSYFSSVDDSPDPRRLVGFLAGTPGRR